MDKCRYGTTCIFILDPSGPSREPYLDNKDTKQSNSDRYQRIPDFESVQFLRMTPIQVRTDLYRSKIGFGLSMVFMDHLD